MRSEERRTDAERRRRIDELLARVSAAREDILEAGLGAVHDSGAADELSRRGRFARAPRTGTPATGVSPRGSRPDG